MGTGGNRRDFAGRRYVYNNSNVRMDERLCLLVTIGVTEHGHKGLVAVEDGHQESEVSWTALRGRGCTISPKLAIDDGALGFWKMLAKCYTDTAHQRCWVHKTAKNCWRSMISQHRTGPAFR